MIDGPSMLGWLRSRRSIRRFKGEPIGRDVLERVVDAATTAPSSTNRQPWRFAIVTDAPLRGAIAAIVKQRTQEMKAVIARGHHAEEFGAYGDFFFEPLEAASAIIVPQFREYPDQLVSFIRSGGGDPASFQTVGPMQTELCGTSASVMLLLLQARAEGLGACWMAGPMVAQREIEALLDIRAPYRMLGAIALGHPAEDPPATRRRPTERIVHWFEGET